MSDSNKNRTIVLAVLEGGLSPVQAAGRFGVSKRWVYTLLARYRSGGLEAVDPQSRRPHTNPHATDPETIAAVLALRESLTKQGLDAGKLRHLAIGRDQGQIIAEHTIDPTKNYQPRRTHDDPEHS
ncbi:MAG TPA: helix-turn-helix domain-containing protein [Beutenbergiaceae bacterium]|nr:helix-turn-helix domain-containing protein [Beutenbergiaceae bacterium]